LSVSGIKGNRIIFPAGYYLLQNYGNNYAPIHGLPAVPDKIIFSAYLIN
jgi:hypothetical protein